ncbi:MULTISPECIES: RNA polymerase sigma factor SigJ [Pseudofrankia]|uniref:RNA polymerase sigma factor SigJ n=1 Tax=Pseudofrankia TaxID=2994363 RepID=UPI000234D91F|nr:MULTISPECIES: RNA polymerase sigma factor SigJ [Pseudofrankia]OHV40692.1 RNA polymerase [Pseudofrankia sp. EUN1h]
MKIFPDETAEGRAAGLAAAFEAERGYLRGLAYRILGSFAEAEDVVQEAWLRLDRADVEPDDLRAWLTVVVGRLCLDELRSARVRREAYVGPWLPEPLAEVGGLDAVAVYTAGTAGAMTTQRAAAASLPDPAADRVTLAESVSMAMLVVMETLTPAERTALVLHDVFGYGFAEIGEITGRTSAASRQLASRARRHVRARGARFDPDPARGWRVAEAFQRAADGGDLTALLELLDPDVVLRSDGGGVAQAARRPIVGAEKVARFLLGILAKAGQDPAGPRTIVPAEVNGGPGFLGYLGDELTDVVALTTEGGRVLAIDLVANPVKLRHLRGS